MARKDNADTPPYAPKPSVERTDPPGFRLRRGQNWLFLGLTYASYYLCRYNLGIVAPEFKAALGFSNSQYGSIQTARNAAYAIGQLINGLFTDRLGGKRAMTLGAIGTIFLNLAFGLTAWSKIGWLFFALMLIRLADGYVQAFGAPGMIKINTAWFRRRERGTFAGIFGIMINLGQVGAGQLGGLLATGFAVPLLFFTIAVPKLDWRYMFIVPPVVVAVIIILMNLMVKNHPEQAGYPIVHDDESHSDDPYEPIHFREVLQRIATNPIVWIIAGAYFCTGFVRAAVADWYTVYLDDVWNVGKQHGVFYAFVWGLPVTASVGSLGSGLISDKFFGGRRAPVAALLYGLQTLLTLMALWLTSSPDINSPALAAAAIISISMMCNSTHSILGAAAPMDIGERKMAGFASGVIDSFQYFGAMLAGFGLGSLIDHFAQGSAVQGNSPVVLGFSPTVWFVSMLPFGFLGTILMTYLWFRHRGTDTPGA